MTVDSSSATATTGVDSLRLRIAGAIKQAATATGTSFQYLLTTAKMESDFNPKAAASTSSASGLFQFIGQTWLGTVKEAGAQLGYGQYADAITKSGSGNYSVNDPAARSAVMNLRDDPAASSAMAGVLTRSNSFKLTGLIGRGSFEVGDSFVTLALPGLPAFSPLICYEAIFPAEVLGPGARPQWLLNVTNDAWFGVSSGPYQHLTSARLRTIEEGLPMIRAANTGVSAVVDAYGRVLAALDMEREGVIDHELPPARAVTPYGRWHDWLLLVLVCILALPAMIRLRARKT